MAHGVLPHSVGRIFRRKPVARSEIRRSYPRRPHSPKARTVAAPRRKKFRGIFRRAVPWSPD